MSTPLKVLFSVLLLATLAGTGFSARAIMQLRSDIEALAAKVSQIERRPPIDANAPARESTSLPAGPRDTAALPSPSEIDVLRRQVADLSARLRSLAGGAPAGAGPETDDAAPTSGASLALPAPGGPTFDDATREAIKDLVRETLAEDPATAIGSVTFSAPVLRGFHDIETLARELGLSDFQKTEIEKVWARQDQEMAAFFEPSNELPDPEAVKARMQELGRKTDERIKQLLTVEQARRYDELRPQHGDSIFFGVKAREAPAKGK